MTRIVRVRTKLTRHISSGFNILGYDNLAPSRQTENITVRNNLLYDVDSKYTSSSTAGPARLAIIGAGPKNITFDHNTVDNNGASTIFIYGGATPTGVQIVGFTLTNNLLKQNSWAIYGDAIGPGQPALAHYAPGATGLPQTFAGRSPKLYPVGNDFPTVAQWLPAFTSRPPGHYALGSTSLSCGAAPPGEGHRAALPALHTPL